MIQKAKAKMIPNGMMRNAVAMFLYEIASKASDSSSHKTALLTSDWKKVATSQAFSKIKHLLTSEMFALW